MAKLTEKEKLDFFNKNQKLLHYQLKRFSGYNTFEYEELIQIASLAMWEALCTYDTDIKSKKTGKPVAIAQHVSYSIMAAVQSQIGLLHGSTKRIFKAVQDGAITNSSEDITELELEDEKQQIVIQETDPVSQVTDFLAILRPLFKECLQYKFGLRSDITPDYRDVADTIVELALLNIKTTFKNNFEEIKFQLTGVN